LLLARASHLTPEKFVKNLNSKALHRLINTLNLLSQIMKSLFSKSTTHNAIRSSYQTTVN
jgi:hypothetical protein